MGVRSGSPLHHALAAHEYGIGNHRHPFRLARGRVGLRLRLLVPVEGLMLTRPVVPVFLVVLEPAETSVLRAKVNALAEQDAPDEPDEQRHTDLSSGLIACVIAIS